jgi:hypothetical protein
MLPINLFNQVKAYLLPGVAALAVILGVGWYVTHNKLEAERSGRALDAATYRQAQSDYKAKAEAEAREKERKYAEVAKQADASYAALLDKYNASLLRYKAQANISTGSGTNLSVNPRTPSGTDRSDPGAELSPELIVIPFEDALICAENTAKLITAQQEWLNKLK